MLGQPPPRGAWGAEAWAGGLTPSNHTPWTLATGPCEPEDLFFLAKGFTLWKSSLYGNGFPLRKSGLFVDQLSFLLPPGQRSGSRQSPLPLFLALSFLTMYPPFLPLLPAASIPKHPIPPFPPSAPGPAPFATAPALGPLHWPFLLSTCFSPAVTASFISFALKNGCLGGEPQEGNDCVYLDGRGAASSQRRARATRYSIAVPPTLVALTHRTSGKKALHVPGGSVWLRTPIEMLEGRRLQILVASLCL